ncbi:MAG: hypothetical protein R6V83_07910 [Candidatus Thorarchaeota archaeon]
MADRIKTSMTNATEKIQTKRENIRDRIAGYKGAERAIHLLISTVLGINTALMLFTLIHVIGWLVVAGVPLTDSLPLVLYVIPLLIILPSLVYSYYTSRSANTNLIVTMIESVIFVLLTSLVHGFLLLVLLNIVAVFFMLVYGQFGFKGDLKELGKKAIAWFIFMNLLGLAMPTATYAMGRNPIATVEVDEISPMRFSVSVNENSSLLEPSLNALESNDFGLDLKVSADDVDRHQKTINWLYTLNSTDLNYSMTFSSNRETYFQHIDSPLGSAQLLRLVFESHYTLLNQTFHLVNFTSALRKPSIVFLDMTLSSSEWSLLFSRIRAVDFGGFSGVVRSMLDSSNRSIIREWTNRLRGLAESFGVSLGLVVEPFVMDDSLDGDDNTMRACGLISDTLSVWDSIEVSCNRTLFSEAMAGDVGEYFLYTYSQTVRSISHFDSLRMSNVGISTTTEVSDSVYSEIDIISDDILLASSGSPECITVESLTSLLASFGEESIDYMAESISNNERVDVTYTFRIYAFRVVFVAIDAFDLIFF